MVLAAAGPAGLLKWRMCFPILTIHYFWLNILPPFGDRLQMIKTLLWLVLLPCALSAASSVAAQSRRPSPAAPDYAAPPKEIAVPPNIREICFSAEDMAALRARMVQQEFVLFVLQCRDKDGSKLLERPYTNFIQKFGPELAANTVALRQIKRLNIDVVITEYANRTAMYAPVDREFCSRGKRALDWALDPKVSSLSQVPPPYDLGPDMRLYACPMP